MSKKVNIVRGDATIEVDLYRVNQMKGITIDEQVRKQLDVEFAISGFRTKTGDDVTGVDAIYTLIGTGTHMDMPNTRLRIAIKPLFEERLNCFVLSNVVGIPYPRQEYLIPDTKVVITHANVQCLIHTDTVTVPKMLAGLQSLTSQDAYAIRKGKALKKSNNKGAKESNKPAPDQAPQPAPRKEKPQKSSAVPTDGKLKPKAEPRNQTTHVKAEPAGATSSNWATAPADPLPEEKSNSDKGPVVEYLDVKTALSSHKDSPLLMPIIKMSKIAVVMTPSSVVNAGVISQHPIETGEYVEVDVEDTDPASTKYIDIDDPSRVYMFIATRYTGPAYTMRGCGPYGPYYVYMKRQ